jgi:hypothetical protein
LSVVRIKFVISSLLVAATLAGNAALADPPKKKPTYPPPEQSSTVGTLGQHHTDPGGPPKPSAPPPPVAAPVVPKVEAEPPAPVAAPERIEVHPDGAATGASSGTAAPMVPVPMGPPPTGFLPDHPFISGIVAGLVGTDIGSKLYGGPMMGDQDGVVIGYAIRFGAILLVAWLIFRMISRRASGINEPGLAPPGRREPTFGRGPDAGAVRREPTFSRRDHH